MVNDVRIWFMINCGFRFINIIFEKMSIWMKNRVFYFSLRFFFLKLLLGLSGIEFYYGI